MHVVRHGDLADFLDREPIVEETADTAALIAGLRPARRRGYLTRGEFLRACRWKSPRPVHRYGGNPPGRIRRVTHAALATRSERRRFELLTSLDGVGPPMASAVLTLTDPERYGVIDVRVWRLLYAFGVVQSKPSGTGFRFEDWDRYLTTLRHHAKRLGVSVRAVERTLWGRSASSYKTSETG